MINEVRCSQIAREGNGSPGDGKRTRERAGIEEIIKALLTELGEDPEREGLQETPRRVRETLDFFAKGYSEDPEVVLNGALFSVPYTEMVIVKELDFYSLCEHHLLPFFGVCHIAYIPDGKVVGLSKIPRLVEVFSRRLQIQERMTVQIAETLYEKVNPLGVGVVIEAQHLCMIMRGVQKQNSVAVTSSMLGVFQTDSKVRTEFLHLIKKK